MTDLSTKQVLGEIRRAHRNRVFLMDQRKRADNALGAFLRRALGWRRTAPAEVRKEIEERVAAAIEAALRAAKTGEPATDELYLEFEDIIDAALAARAPMAKAEHEALLHMNKAVRKLPVWNAWAKSVPGVAEASIGTIVGECGDLGSYKSTSAIWKRMGLAVVDGHRQGRPGPNASVATWIAEGYSPRRRSYAWVLGDVFVKVKGPYRVHYDRIKAEEEAKAAARGQTIEAASVRTKKQPDEFMSKGHVHLRAKRRVEKLFLKHLRAAWIAASQAEGVKTVDMVSAKDRAKIVRPSSAQIDDQVAA
jgi:hypothetical protein